MWCKSDSCDFIGDDCLQLAVAPIHSEEKGVWSLNSKDSTVWEWKYGSLEEEGQWVKVGWNAKGIFCDDQSKLNYINKNTGAVWSYDGEPLSWTLV